MRPLRPRVAALAVIPLLLVGTACGDEALHGVVRADPLDVAAVALPDVTPEALRGGGVLDADGRLVMRAAPDRLLLTYFGFLNCPDVCPTTLADVRTALWRLEPAEAARVDLAFVTVDPDRDTPEALAEYLAAFLPTFHAVRADAAALAPALEAFLATAEVSVAGDGTVDVAHSAALYAVDGNGTVVVEWPFGTSATALAEDLRLLLGGPA